MIPLPIGGLPWVTLFLIVRSPWGPHDAQFSSGSPLVRFSPDGVVITPQLREQGRGVLGGGNDPTVKLPVLWLYQSMASSTGGRVVVTVPT